MVLLVACERPLNEVDEPTATPAPDLFATPETGLEEIAPTLIPTQEVGPPPEATPDAGAQPSPEGGDTSSGETEGSQETGQGEQGGEVAPTAVPQATTLPSGEQVHIVQAGDNLYRIGLRYGCTVAELSAYNGIFNPDYIFVSQQILIPTTCGGG
jgi:LysM repeat protein